MTTTETTAGADAIILATGQIVAAMQARGGTSGPIENVIREVRKALTDPIREPEPAPVELVPAVPVNKSVKDDFIVCLEDGKKFKSLKRHLRTKFDMTPEQYRTKWGLPASYPMVAPSYSAKRSQLAKDNGLGTK